MRSAAISMFLIALAGLPSAQSKVPAEPIQVMVLGTFHFDNPGLDYRNVEVDDVLTPKRQAEIQDVTRALAGFGPTMIGVEWSPGAPDAPYQRFLAGELADNRSEVVQIGFRLARDVGLDRVHGFDMPMSLPFGPAFEFAERENRQDIVGHISEVSDANVAAQETTLRDHGIAATLRLLNDPSDALTTHALYRETLMLGSGSEQPGLEAVVMWYRRNLGICALLLQAAKPGDRVIVMIGAGHLALLQQCVTETPGYQLIDARDYLPSEVGL